VIERHARAVLPRPRCVTNSRSRPAKVLDVSTAYTKAASTPLTQRLTGRFVFLIKFQQLLP
jgi:hypothetical protein